jgi:DNA-binding SARP family transcriptional activator
MEKLQVYLFGRFQITFDNQTREELRVVKAQELFSYLLLNHERPHCRDALATVLWSDTSTVQSKRYLRRALWQLQQVLPGDNVILAEDDWIQINPQAPIWVDATCFEQGCLRTQEIPGENLSAEDFRQLREVIQLYQGSLLEGWYHDWCLFERERFRQMFLVCLDKLMLYCETHDKYEAGIEYGRQILRYDQAREHTHRRLMRLYCRLGNRTDALYQYEKCAALLDQELQVEPGQATKDLFQKIRTAQLDKLAPRTRKLDPPSPKKRRLLQKMYGELRQIRSVLTNIQEQVEHQIEIVESALNE